MRIFSVDSVARSRVRFWVINVLCWLVLAILFTVWYHFDFAMRGLPVPGGVGETLYLYGLRSLLWVLLTPLVLKLVEKFPLTGRRRLPNFCAHLGFSIVGMLFNYAVVSTAYSYRGQMPYDMFLVHIFGHFRRQPLIVVLYYWGILLVGVMRDYLKQREAAAKRESMLHAQLAESQLRALQGQMKPHFIHNALNAVAALVKVGKPDAAVDTLAHVSGLLRTLSDAPGKHLVTLGEEVQFVSRVLAIERVRFGEKLDARIDIAEECRGVLVPSLVLQPLVENAIKHGIARRTRSGRVIVRARRDADRLRLEVVNDGPPIRAVTEPRSAPGVGLAATLQRLERIYGKDFTARFDFQREEDVSAVLVLPLAPPLL